MKNKKMPKVAYFSMEFGLDNSFKSYAGGLGILAGDYLKGAKEYNFPVIGIGIKWKQGYTDQRIDSENKPYDCYKNYEYDFLEDTGVTVSVTIRKREVFCKVWKLNKFDNNDIYLLDTDIPQNQEMDPWITGQLYGWFPEERVAQEIVLGVGGVKAMRALGMNIDIFHFNEGHAVFAGLELLREKMEDQKMEFEKAIEETRKEVVFTTHTPIVQGNESHDLDRLFYMGANLHLNKSQMKRIGGSPFNMTVAALRLAKRSNGVAKLHNETSNKMWSKVKDRSEIVGVTNAIHRPTWVDMKMLELTNKKDMLWERHMENKRSLIEFINERKGIKLDENVMIVGFSRRAAPYKRSDFIFTNPAKVEPLFKKNKFVIVFSGKAHPFDDNGKKIVQRLVEMEKKYPNNVVFLENYDMEIGKMLTRGADIWLNNPRRPKEASGTSGMKAAMNGVLNVSILDGWWPEACNHGVNGWQFGDGYENKNEDKLDKNDLKSMYKVFIQDVLPTYYNNKDKWIDMMANSIESTKDQFNVKRMLEEYYDLLYKF
jgi:starch phosphorylase